MAETTETTFPRPTGDLVAVEWFVLYCQPKAEAQVAKALARHGIDAYIPASRIERRIRRRFDPRPRVVTTTRPAFPRYVFAGVPPSSWFDAKRIPGAIAVVGFDGVPLRVPDRTIADILVAQDMGLFDVGPNETMTVRLEIGQTVRIVSGPLEGYMAEVEAIPKKRGPVLVAVNGISVHTPIDQIRVVA